MSQIVLSTASSVCHKTLTLPRYAAIFLTLSFFLIGEAFSSVENFHSTDEASQTVAHRYYPSGAKAKTIYPGGTENGTGHVEYTYYPDGKLWKVIDKLSSTTTPRTTIYTYFPDGRLHTLTRPNGTVRTITYDDTGRPQTLTERDATGKLLHFAKHQFYPNDSLRHRYTLPNAPAASPAPEITLTYNADNQISTYNGQSLYHDADGNLTLMPLPGIPGLHSAAYNSRNQLTNVNNIAYDYDRQGNRKSTTAAGAITTLTHDTSGGLSKQLVRSKGGQSTRTVWGLGVLYEVNPDGSVTYHHHDLTGSTIALSDGTGKITERISYTPYGQILSRLTLSGSPRDTPYLFTGFFGNETDASGLIHMRARYYSPLLHRFLNSDPARAGNNWYAYAAGNPFGFVDPSGLGIEDALNSIQSTLSFLGMLPVVGAAFDLVNAGISLARGNYVDAGVSFLAAVPGIGDFVAGAKIAAGGAALYGGYRATQSLSRAGYSFSGNLYSGIPIPTRSTVDTILYRGVPANTTRYADAIQGYVRPRGTAIDNNTLVKHILGADVSSGVTSWTTNKSIAQSFAGNGGTIIQINKSSVADKIIQRPFVEGKYAGESEILLQGTIKFKP